MKKTILISIFILFLNCAFFNPCYVVELKEEMCVELIKADSTYKQHHRIERHIKDLYKWKRRKCNCYIDPRKKGQPETKFERD